MRNKKLMAHYFTLFLVMGLSIAVEAMQLQYGISADRENKTITLNGEKNPVKTISDGGKVVELESFRTQVSGFPWDEFSQNEYTLFLENVNIHTNRSINCLLWFMEYGFKVTINPSSYISLEGLENFIERAPKRNANYFADLISKRWFPEQNGFNRVTKNERVKRMLAEKGYTFDNQK